MSDDITTEEQPTEQTDAELERQVLEEVRQVNKDLWVEAERQGIAGDVRKAIEEFGEEDVYFGSVNGKLFAYRPLYDDEWQEALEKAKTNGRPETEAMTDKEMTELCVVAGLNNVIGKRARNGLYPTIARQIGEVSAWSSDFPPGINPRAKLQD